MLCRGYLRVIWSPQDNFSAKCKQDVHLVCKGTRGIDLSQGPRCIKLSVDSWLKLCVFTKPETCIHIPFVRFIKLCVHMVLFYTSQSLWNSTCAQASFSLPQLAINGWRRPEPAVFISTWCLLHLSVHLSMKQTQNKKYDRLCYTSKVLPRQNSCHNTWLCSSF